jgi:hypothetical protein
MERRRRRRSCDVVFQMGQKYLTITSSLRKHQSTTILLFKLAVFLLLSGQNLMRYTNLIGLDWIGFLAKTYRQKCTHCRNAHSEKSTKTFQTKRSNCVAGSYQTPPLLILFLKKSVKLFARVKVYVQVMNLHALVRGLQNRTQQTSMRSCAVENELMFQ